MISNHYLVHQVVEAFAVRLVAEVFVVALPAVVLFFAEVVVVVDWVLLVRFVVNVAVLLAVAFDQHQVVRVVDPGRIVGLVHFVEVADPAVVHLFVDHVHHVVAAPVVFSGVLFYPGYAN